MRTPINQSINQEKRSEGRPSINQSTGRGLRNWKVRQCLEVSLDFGFSGLVASGPARSPQLVSSLHPEDKGAGGGRSPQGFSLFVFR